MAVENPDHLKDAYPKRATIAEERQHRKEQLAGALRVFGKFGFSDGVAGHITARDPELTDHFWVNPFAISFNKMKVSDLILVSEDGKIVEGGKDKMLNKAAFAIHSRIHVARPDVIAAAHAHSLYGKTWSAFGRPLDALTQDSCMFYGDHGVFDDFTGVVLKTSEGDRIAEALQDKKAVILKNHGILTVGRNVEEAAFWFIAMERCCQSQILAEMTGLKTQPISHEVAIRTRDKEVGFPFSGWFSYQPIWQDIVAEQPDFLN